MTKKNVDDRQTLILEAAKRRFAHYGMAKTTMAEIAKDLSLSKALLYYYYPDKTRLYVAVLENVIDEYTEGVDSRLTGSESVEQAIFAVLETRLELVKKYYYIVEYAYDNRKDTTREIEKTFVRLFTAHRQSIKKAFRQGIDRGELKPFEVQEYARIFLFATLGLRLMAIKGMSVEFVPTEEEFAYILEMQKKLAKVFIDGLRG